MRPISSGGGFPAIWYSLRTAWRAGGLLKFYRAMRSRNACKTCALGMGGQSGGMVNEAGHFPEVCKKSMQAMASDMQGRIRPEFFATYSIDQLRQFSPRELEHLGRLNEPVYAGPGETHYRPISWDDAMALCVDRFRRTPPDQSFFYSSGRSSNEAAFLLQLFARLYGTNNVNNCSYYCHQASGVGLRSALGTTTATVTLDDIAKCDLFFLIGGNPASNHPRLMTELMNLRKRGGHVVVVNPMRETGLVNFSVPSKPMSLLFGQEIASHYVQPHIGGDIAFLTAIAQYLLTHWPSSEWPLDLDYLNDRIEDRGVYRGWDVFSSHVESLEWDALQTASGVDGHVIEDVAELYAKSERTIFAWTMGITHHVHGVDNVRAIINLALLRGMVGKPGAGLLPIRGHSNVQGIGSMGFTPTLARHILEGIEKHYGVTLPTTPGLDTLACVEAMQRGELKSAWCLGGNLFGSNPDANYCSQAFGKLDSCVYLNTTLNTGHAWGRAKETLILPVRARDEEAQATTQESMFNFVRLSDGGPPRLPGPRGEVEIIAHWGRHVLGDAALPDSTSATGGGRYTFDWRELERHQNIRKLIAASVPGYEALADIDATRKEFQIPGRTFHEPRFKTESGKARFHAVKLPGVSEPTTRVVGSDPAFTLRLMTIRSEGQFNTVVYEEEDLYRNQTRRDIILMNPADIERLGLRADWRVTVRSAVGEMKDIVVRPFDIRAGNAAMYYPEANVLVPRVADPESRTPAFKAVRVTVIAQPAEQKRVPLAVVGRG